MIMTVKELKEILSHYNDDDRCYLAGGENGYGWWAELSVKDTVIWEDG